MQEAHPLGRKHYPSPGERMGRHRAECGRAVPGGRGAQLPRVASRQMPVPEAKSASARCQSGAHPESGVDYFIFATNLTTKNYYPKHLKAISLHLLTNQAHNAAAKTAKGY